MTTALELAFKYRQLVGICESGAGLSFDDIEVVSTIESLYAVSTEDQAPLRWRDRPTLGTEVVNLTALLRGPKVRDRVGVVALGPEGMVCTNAPYMADDGLYEIVFDDQELGVSYRFIGRVVWSDEVEETGELAVELRFTGVPVLVRYGENSTRPASHGDETRAEGTPRPERLTRAGKSAEAA